MLTVSPQTYVSALRKNRLTDTNLLIHAGILEEDRIDLWSHAMWYRAYVMIETNDRALTKAEAREASQHAAEITRIASEYKCTARFDGDVRGFLIRIHTPEKFSDNMGGGIGIL